jgi:RP/EB family microtubule-associated protein
LAKIEQCATGAVYCAVMDALYPNTFPFSKVRWECKNEYEFVENYKVLQQAFDKNGVKRHIDVNKMIKAKYQDNLEFCQWLKAFFEKNYNGEPYDAVGRRKGQDLFYLGGTSVPPVKKSEKGPATTSSAPKTIIASTTAAKPAKVSSGKEEAKVSSEEVGELQAQI